MVGQIRLLIIRLDRHLLAVCQLSWPASEKEKKEEARMLFHRQKISSFVEGMTRDFILECGSVKVKYDCSEAETTI